MISRLSQVLWCEQRERPNLFVRATRGPEAHGALNERGIVRNHAIRDEGSAAVAPGDAPVCHDVKRIVREGSRQLTVHVVGNAGSSSIKAAGNRITNRL